MYWFSRVLVTVFSLTIVACVTEQQAVREGEGAFDSMRQQMVETSSLTTRAYVNCISRAIVAEIDPPYDSLDWEVVVFEDASVNAFALPGGNIGVFTGILSVAETTDQLASVIGHEVAHVTERHSVARMNRAMAANVGVTVADIFDPNAGAAVGMLAQYGILLPYGRGQESEADVVGLRYMAKAGFDPRASVKLW
ncbi:MAG: M48 family metallopeptidase, partial [Gammaproteobacteria bacterium]